MNISPHALTTHLLFAAALTALSAFVVWIMRYVRVMDTPDARKAHNRPIPKSGGIGVVVAFLTGIIVLYEVAEFSRIADPYFRGIIMASVAIAVVSFLDDMRDFPFLVKLVVQVGAALTAVLSGIWVQVYSLPFFGPIDAGLLGIPATLFWILFVTNAMNFIDGLNGLAAGVGLVACIFLAAIGLMQGASFVYFAALLLAAGLLGFLPFNFPYARIFMGDVGSQFTGFVLAMLGVVAARFERVELSFLIVPLLLSGVLSDVLFTLCRRVLAGDRVTQAHRGHLYQIAHRAGVDPRVIALVHWGFAAFGGVCCLLFLADASAQRYLILALPVVPQVLWFLYVWRRAAKADIGRW